MDKHTVIGYIKSCIFTAHHHYFQQNIPLSPLGLGLLPSSPLDRHRSLPAADSPVLYHLLQYLSLSWREGATRLNLRCLRIFFTLLVAIFHPFGCNFVKS